MKLFLIKIGKAIGALKRDGLVKGGKRIIKAIPSLFFRVGSGDILFVTGGTAGDSARYRCHHIMEELELRGFKCSRTVQDNPFLPGCADKFKIFIFQRTLYTPKIESLINKIKEQKKEIIFDTDDLLYDPEFFRHSDYLKNINKLEARLYEGGLGSQILNDPYVKVCATTTSYLADKLKQLKKKVFVVPNKLSNKDLEIIEKIIRKKPSPLIPLPRGEGDIVKIGYFSGTISHNKDFATIIDALTRIMEKYPQVELFLAGPLDAENKFISKFKNRITRLPYVPREKHFENIAKVDINIAPLEIGNPFCEAKSELKFFEAGIMGVPTVAAATGTFKEAISDGADGFTAQNTREWIDKLEKLITDGDLRKRMGEKARGKALSKYTNKNSSNEEYYSFLRSAVKQEGEYQC